VSKYTPGPWEIRWGGNFTSIGAPGYNARVDVSRCGGIKYGQIGSVDFDYDNEKNDEQRANARLIAAAPDLLEAAKVLDAFTKEQHYDHCVCVYCRHMPALRAAILKAEPLEDTDAEQD
jgi:hypothetical protein